MFHPEHSSIRRSADALVWLRVLGLAAIAWVLPYRPATGPLAWLEVNEEFLFVVLPIMAFLWVTVTGQFGWAGASRSDWPVLGALTAALASRELLTLHSIEELLIHFYSNTLRGRHSFVHPSVNLFAQSLGGDPYGAAMHFNGALGAAATLPLYLFVRHRSGTRVAAASVAALFALHPLVVRFAPTDGPYSLLFVLWFAGLAFLSDPGGCPSSAVAGAVLLGLASVCRQEGFVILAISLLLLDPSLLWRRVRNHPHHAACAAASVVALLAIQYVTIVRPNTEPGAWLPAHQRIHPGEILEAAFGLTPLTDRVLAAVLPVGVLAGILDRRLRFAVGAMFGACIFVMPFGSAYAGGYAAFHYYVPCAALQAIVAGAGAAWTGDMLSRRLSVRALSHAPGLVVAASLFAAGRAILPRENAISEEFDLLRRNLAPAGHVDHSCALVSITSFRSGDVDIQNLEAVVPGAPVGLCNLYDCSDLVRTPCVRYLRSIGCWYSDEATLSEHEQAGMPALSPFCARMEQALHLTAIEERLVEPRDYWLMDHGFARWPVTIGLYRVDGMRGVMPKPP